MSVNDDRVLRGPSVAEKKYAIVAGSDVMANMLTVLFSLARSDISPVTIYGEPGTGKRTLGRIVHDESARSDNAFVVASCREKFGERLHLEIPDLAAQAGGGSLMLLAVDALSIPAQLELLGWINNWDARTPNTRLILTVEHDFADRESSALLDSALRERIDAISVMVPALRERGQDIERLARHFLGTLSVDKKGFSNEALSALHVMHWPENLRSLERAVRRACEFGPGEIIDVAALGIERRTHARRCLTLAEAREMAEEQAVRQSILSTQGNIAKAARLLGVSRVTIYKLIAKYGIRSTD